MNNNEFLKTLRRLLAPLDSTTRDNIVREIESLTLDPDAGEASLEQRFGQPRALAAQYLDGVETVPSVVNRAGKFGRGFLIGLGCLTFAVIVLAVVLNWYFDRDQFDYADENADELMQTTAGWNGLDVPVETTEVSIDVDQAKVVVYWHEQNQLRWKCKSEDSLKYEESRLAIRHGSCLVFLPPAASNFSARQGQVVLVRPQHDVQVSLRQASLKFAENGSTYQYEIADENSEIAPFTSVDNADTTIRIDAVESSVDPYSY